MNLSKIHHIAIIVSDYEAAKDFYVNKLGFSVIRENYRPERKDWKLDLRVNEYTELEIFAEENPPKRVNRPEACGLRHLAFCVESVEQTVKELAEVGIKCEPIRVDDYTGKKMTFFHDPDGLPLELHEQKEVNKMIFRKAEKEDFDKIRSLYWNLIDQEKDDPSFPQWKKGIHPSDEMIQASIDKGELYVLADGDEIAACVIANDEKVDGYADAPWQINSDEIIVLHVLAVNPGQRGKGLARRLVENVIELERKAGRKALRLDVIENNTTAEKLYQKLGFQYVQTKTLYYDVVGKMTFKLYELVL